MNNIRWEGKKKVKLKGITINTDKDNFRSLCKADEPNVSDDFACAPVNFTIKLTGQPQNWRVCLKIKDVWMRRECIDGIRSWQDEVDEGGRSLDSPAWLFAWASRIGI